MSNRATETRLRLYRTMYLIRRTEEMLAAEYHPANEMRCPMHLCVGQEAMPAALGCVMRREDVLMSHYRSHGYYIAKGAPLDAMVAEFYGKTTGANSGIAGSMELAAHEFNFCSGAVVGGSLLIPIGAAFAQKYRKIDEISIAVMGDGSFDEGFTYDVFNLASLYRLPLLIICENNHYAAHTALDRRMAVPQLAERAQAFGLPISKLNGNDPERLLAELEKLIPAIRKGGGPFFMEIETYRFSAHVGPAPDDALGYRSAEEIEHWRKRDPVPRMREVLLGECGQSQICDIETAIEGRIRDAIAAAKQAEFPDFGASMAMNYAGTYSPVVRHFVESATDRFAAGQAEARLGPF